MKHVNDHRILDTVFHICTDSVCIFRMSGYGTTRGGKRQKEKLDLQWEYWKDNMGLKLMMKQKCECVKKEKWKPGMGLGNGHGRSGRDWGLKGEWVKKSSPEAVNALKMAFLLSPPISSPPLFTSSPPLNVPPPPVFTSSPPLNVPPPPLFTQPHGFAFAPPIPADCHPPRNTNCTPEHTFKYSPDLVFIPPSLGKGWGRRFPVETPDRWDSQSQSIHR